MPKRTVYTCDCCGKEYEEPSTISNDNDFVSSLAFKIWRENAEGKYMDTYSIKKYSETYFCPECTLKFLSLLKDFGFTKLHSNNICDNTEIKL